MKRLAILLAVAVMILSQSCAQKSAENEVPAKIQKAFAQKSANAKKVKWDKENANEWEAEFKMDGKDYSANFSSDGTWKETEYEIRKSDIPSTVKTKLDTDFSGYKMEEAEVSETTKGKVYEFKLENDETDVQVAIAPDGKIVEKKIAKEESEEHEKGEENEGNEENEGHEND